MIRLFDLGVPGYTAKAGSLRPLDFLRTAQDGISSLVPLMLPGPHGSELKVTPKAGETES